MGSKSIACHELGAVAKLRIKNSLALSSHRNAFHDIACYLMLAAVVEFGDASIAVAEEVLNILHLHALQ